MLTRRSLLDLIRAVEEHVKAPAGERKRMVLTGHAGVGKSATLLQLASHCQQSGWIVVPQPNGSAIFLFPH